MISVRNIRQVVSADKSLLRRDCAPRISRPVNEICRLAGDINNKFSFSHNSIKSQDFLQCYMHRFDAGGRELTPAIAGTLPGRWYFFDAKCAGSMPKTINPILESINCKAAVRNVCIVDAITKTCDHSLPSKPYTGIFACLPHLTLIALRYQD